MPNRHSLTLFSFLLIGSGAAHCCTQATFEAPATDVVADLPRLSWSPVEGATAYRVDMVSRVPEGPVLERRTLRTMQTSIDGIRIDPSRSTKVTLSVEVECGRVRAPSATRMILVAPAPRCADITEAIVDRSTRAREARWSAPANTDVEVQVFDAETASLLSHLGGTGLRRVEVQGTRSAVVVLRTRCGSSHGASRYLFVD